MGEKLVISNVGTAEIHIKNMVCDRCIMAAPCSWKGNRIQGARKT